MRTLRSIARASGRVSIVIMILLMSVDPERNLFVFHRSQFNCESSGHATQEVELVFVHSDGVESFCEDVAQFCDASLLSLDCFLVLDEGFKRLDDAVCVCHSVSVWV